MSLAPSGRHIHSIARSFLFAGTALALMPGGGAWAQASSSAESPSFAIAAQPLEEALRQFTRQSGVQVGYEPGDVAGRTSNAVSGAKPPAEALSQLLSGTGLTFRYTTANAVRLERAPLAAAADGEGGAVVLGPVRVQDESSGRGNGTGTVRPPADTRGTYTVAASGSSAKLDLAIKDTPQVVNIITRQRLDDQNLTQVADVIAQAPGVTVQQQGVPGMGQVDYYSRGFRVKNVMFDGLLTQGAGNGDFVLWSILDTAVFDRVELVQGSTGLATGTGDPSTAVNFVRKRPTEEFQVEGSLAYGSWNRVRATVDVGGAIDKAGTIRARAVGAYQEGGTWQDRVNARQYTLYGIVEADVTSNLMLTGGLNWTDVRVDDAAAFGSSSAFSISNPMTEITYDPTWVSSASVLGRNFNTATDWSYAKIRMLNPFAKAEWRFAGNWRLGASYMYADVHQVRHTGAMGQTFYNVAENVASYSWAHLEHDGKTHNWDINIAGKFELFGRDHEVILGYSGYSGEIVDGHNMTSGAAIAGPDAIGCMRIRISDWNNGNIAEPRCGHGVEFINLGPAFHPLPNIYYDPLRHSNMRELLDRNPGNRKTENQRAFYIGTRLRPLKWAQLILGGRLENWGRKYEEYASNLLSFTPDGYVFTGELTFTHRPDLSWHVKTRNEFTPYAGLVLNITRDVTAYASYTGITKPAVNWVSTWGTGGPVDWSEDQEPITGNSKEVGVKAGFFDNRLNVQLTGYRMQQLERSPTTGVNRKLTGVQGIELNLSGQITDRINISGGYSYLDVFNNVPHGTDRLGCFYGRLRSFECPAHTVKLFGTVQATDALMVGAGFQWKSKTGVDRPNSSHAETVNNAARLTQNAYAVVDLMARYRLSDSFTLGANIGNVFNKSYFTSLDTYSGYYGAPRNVMLSLSGRFR